ncbi:MAG TPA: hypothetical protein VMU80_11940 [Bryobacteraceae bacterium]|nr:hypothetical protein [Bryobacteraceae bacterium]
MKKTITFFAVAVAMVITQNIQAQVVTHLLHVKMFPLSVAPDATAPPILPGIVAFGTTPPLDGQGNEEWPCFTGGSDADCSSIPAGAVVVGMPYQYWSLAACNISNPGESCGQIYWSFSSNTASGDVQVSETIKQGNNVIYKSGVTDLGPGTAPFVSFVWDEIGFGPNACSGCVAPVKGAAEIMTTATVGSSTMSGHAWLLLE